MSSNMFGDAFKIITFGESHGPAVGVVIDGVIPGMEFNIENVQKLLNRRRPGTSEFVSRRKEQDKVEVLSGVFEGKTTGAPLCLVVYNKDPDSSVYEGLKDVFRPGSGDFTWFKKFGVRDWRGGGRLSGRETVGRVAAGAVAMQQLREYGIEIFGFVREIGGIKIEKFVKENIEKDPLCCPDPEASRKMQERIREVMKEGDSVGGIVEVQAHGVPAGIGDPVFSKLDAQLAMGLMSIGAVKGVEIGDGFKLAGMKGSQSNDEMTSQGFASNRCGGILGGISNGEPIVARIAVKPTPSIGLQQRTLDVLGRERKIRITGRHDPCIAPRIVPVAEAMMAIVILDALLKQKGLRSENNNTSIEEMRILIDKLDDEILLRIARRIQIAQEIGKAKRKLKIPFHDASREKQILRKITNQSIEIGLPAEKIRVIFKKIIELCRNAQGNVHGKL